MPHGVLCFLPSYKSMEKLTTRWKVSVDRLNINIYSKPCLQGTLMKGHPLIRESFLKTVPGWTGKDGSRPPPWVPLLKGIGILSTSLGSKTLNTSSLDLGGTKIKDPVVGATWPRYFAPPLGAFRRDAPALFPSPQSQ